MALSPSTEIIGRLRSVVGGHVIDPQDPGYDALCAGVYGPGLRAAAIVQPADATDVSRVVALAADHDVELAVRGGGHSVAQLSSTQGGILLDMSSLKHIEVDAASHAAWAEAGLTAGEVTAAVAEHGLAIGFGDTGSVGIGGITLGGGVGYLVRKHGLTIDSLLGVEIVTADGQIRLVDAERDSDLFWAIRGGGGNFGIVTRFRYRLVELPSIVGGMLLLPATPDVIAGFMAAAGAAPEELSAIVNVMQAPPMPFLPPERVGELVVMAMIVFAGPDDEGERALAPFRALADPIADFVKPMRYPEMFQEEGGFEGEKPVAVSRTMFMNEVDRSTAQLIIDRLNAHVATTDAMMSVAQLRVLGGAMAGVPVGATAFAHRSSRIMVNVAALFPAGADSSVHDAFVIKLAAALHQGDDGHYVNFIGPEGEDDPRLGYPEATWNRLVEVKRRYDPANLFHRNHNVAP
ncbi:MAG: FAD-binding oxidoreductase [Chloroflexota bacterium]